MRNIAKVSGNVADIVFLEVRDRNQVLVGKRLRDIDDKKVADIAESIRTMGVLQPITVTKNGGLYTVISGAHRWRAICSIWDQDGEEAGEFNIPAHVIHVAAGDEEAVEIAENLHRNDLTKEQRKEMTARYIILIADNKKPADNKQPADNKKGPKVSWITILSEKSGLSRDTMERWWKQYADAVGLTITPSKANVEQQQAFAQWHLEQAEKAKQAEAEKAEQDEQQRQQKALADATDAYQRAKGLYQRACDVALKAGVKDVVLIT